MATNERKTSQPAISATIDGTKLFLAFANGKTIVVDPSQLTEDLQRQAMLHGLKQKLVDAAAISRDPDTGRTASLEDKYAAVEAVYLRLTREHAWNAVARDGSGVGAGGLLRAALIRLYDGRQTPEQIDAFLAGKTDAEKAALRGSGKVAPLIETIKAERAAKSAKGAGVDADALLAGLMDDSAD